MLFTITRLAWSRDGILLLGICQLPQTPVLCLFPPTFQMTGLQIPELEPRRKCPLDFSCHPKTDAAHSLLGAAPAAVSWPGLRQKADFHQLMPLKSQQLFLLASRSSVSLPRGGWKREAAGSS